MIGSHKHSAWHAGSEGRHAASAMRARAYRPLIYQLLMRRRANRIVDGRTAGTRPPLSSTDGCGLAARLAAHVRPRKR